MVGVPRSRACGTCKARKIACTQERPHCRQCLKSSRICTGYQRDRIFVASYTTPGQATIGYRLSPGTGRIKNRDPPRVDPIPYFGNELKHGRITRHRVSSNLLPKAITPHVAYRRQLFDFFTCSHVPADMRQASRQHDGRMWLLVLQELPSWSKALEVSILAVSMARLGRLNQDQALVQESLIYYSKGLMELQKALWDPCLMKSDQTLAACFTLSLYEVTECSSESGLGYVTHHNGCARLIQLRGAEAHSSGLAHHIFTGFRIQEIIQALAIHGPTFLNEPPWTESPWINIPQNPYDRLIGFLAMMPDILLQLDNLKQQTFCDFLAPTLELIDRCWKLDKEIQLWYDDLREQTPGPLYWPQFSADPELSTLFPVAFHFADLVVAHVLSLYWAALVILWATMREMYRLLSPIPSTSGRPSDLDPASADASKGGQGSRATAGTDFDISKLPPLGHRMDWPHSVAKNICQSVEYCMKDEMLALGPASAVPSLMIVAENLKNWPGDWWQHLLWIKTVLIRTHGRGNRLLKFFGRKELKGDCSFEAVK